MKDLLELSKKEGFESKIIGKSVEAKYSNKDFYYLWMCELQQWLRDIYKIHITITSVSQESWMYRITKPGQKLSEGLYGEDFYNHEEAQEEALLESLKRIRKL